MMPKDKQGDYEVDQADDDRSGRDDQPGKVDLGQQIGVVDKRVAALGRGVGEELPRQHGELLRY